jgi:hypothetical protein
MSTATAALAALYFQFFFFQMIKNAHDIEKWALAAQQQEQGSGPTATKRRNSIATKTITEEAEEGIVEEERCAINIYGLPRAFASIVLPSLVQNVIRPNAAYQCDYFIHYYNLTTEVAGRSGQGGHVNPQEILLLREQVLREHAKVSSGGNNNKKPTTSSVIYAVSQEEDFWKQYAHLLNKIHTAKDNTDGNYLYFPWKAKTYTFPTTVDNIIKMWHSIQSVWNLMEEHAAAAAATAALEEDPDSTTTRRQTRIQYTRVAMLRSDVMYLTPIDIWTEANGIHKNVANDQVVIPGFGRHPVSDRLIYGPYAGVQPWAKMRFRSLEQHVSWMHDHHPGWAMHSERFVDATLLPRIRKLGYTIAEHDSMCFFRARVDESVWITDCSSANANVSKVTPTLPSDMKGAMEQILRRACGDVVNVTRTFQALQCPSHPMIITGNNSNGTATTK